MHLWIKDRAFSPAEYVASGCEITPLPDEFAAEVERLRKIKAKLESLSADERAYVAELAARAALPRKQRRALEAAERRAKRKQARIQGRVLGKNVDMSDPVLVLGGDLLCRTQPGTTAEN